jgi:hypothetical protein
MKETLHEQDYFIRCSTRSCVAARVRANDNGSCESAPSDADVTAYQHIKSSGCCTLNLNDDQSHDTSDQSSSGWLI